MMNIRTLALASVAAVALSSPAWAEDPGWYLGFGVGYDNLQPTHMQFPPPPLGGADVRVGYRDNAIGLVNGGYKFESGMRVELELGFDAHKANNVVVESGPDKGDRA